MVAASIVLHAYTFVDIDDAAHGIRAGQTIVCTAIGKVTATDSEWSSGDFEVFDSGEDAALRLSALKAASVGGPHAITTAAVAGLAQKFMTNVKCQDLASVTSLWEELTDARPANPLAQALRRKAASLPCFTAFLGDAYLISTAPSMHAWMKLQTPNVHVAALERYLASGDTSSVASAIEALCGQLDTGRLAMALFSFGIPPPSTSQPAAVASPTEGSLNAPIVFFQDMGEISEEGARERVQLRADAACVARDPLLLQRLAFLVQQRDIDAVKAVHEPALRRLIAFSAEDLSQSARKRAATRASDDA